MNLFVVVAVVVVDVAGTDTTTSPQLMLIASDNANHGLESSCPCNGSGIQ